MLTVLTFLSMDFPVIVINKLFNESFIFLLHLVSHVRDIAQNSFILHLQRSDTTQSSGTCSLFEAPSAHADPQHKAKLHPPKVQFQMPHP